MATAAQPAPAASARRFMWIALALIPLNTVVCIFGGVAVYAASGKPRVYGTGGPDLAIVASFALFSAVALAQFVCGIAATVQGLRARSATSGQEGTAAAIVGMLAAGGAPVGWFFGILGMMLPGGMGGAWGRPLRVRGRQLHPELREGTDWTAGARPDPAGLDGATRRALEALWLHDAQKEHASVPAFARISWLLAAVGAPADLCAWAHRAAIEEIEHARACFALAAGYGDRSHTVEPMPELLVEALSSGEPPLLTLAVESLSDGCQLEDFNADVAAACAAVCEEPVTRGVLERIAREERSHADFSWALLEWLIARDRPAVVPAIERAIASLGHYPRPTAVSDARAALVALADAPALLRHGRLPDARWAALWGARLDLTQKRARSLLRPRSLRLAA